jgi:phosphatidylserine synthase
VPQKVSGLILGLPVTLPAAILLSAAAADVAISPPFAAVLGIGLATLMVSSVPYRSFKDAPVWPLLAGVFATVALAAWLIGDVLLGLEVTIAAAGALFALSGPASHGVRRLRHAEA